MTKNIVGLTTEEVVNSRAKYGSNTLLKEKSKGFFGRFLENLNDPIIKILILALIVEVVFTFGKCNLFEVLGIVIAILIATTVSTASELGSERAFLKMQEETLHGAVKSLRNDQFSEISIADVVVGDVLYISSGETVCADGVILEGVIKVDQSALNGESREVTKAYSKVDDDEWDLSSKGKVFRGSIVTNGNAVMKVCRVGVQTYYGMVARDVQTETRESPLKVRLSRLAQQISRIGYVMAAIVAIVYLFNVFFVDNNFSYNKILESFQDLSLVFSSVINALTLMITVVVVAAPEGLPMMITVVLSANMKKMIKDGVLVKKLVGIETAGSMNILFTDKTGTLTTGRLECDKIVTLESSFKSIGALKKASEIYKLLLLSSKYNTESYVSEGRIAGGNGTDRALAEFFKSETVSKASVIEQVHFSSEKKYSSVTLGDGMQLIKGATEIILKMSDCALGNNGEIVALDYKKIEAEYFEAATGGNRVLAIGYKDKSREHFVFVALVVLKDKIRKGVIESVTAVKRAGVHMVMLTGDGKETAKAIAKECGIITGSLNEIIITSSELNRMNDEEVKNIIPNLCVLARALPQDKTRLVRLSQELDLVVGMTGDGINDAPSLKLADVGFAMGSGADIAKSASDIVLLNNGFFSINRTILYGRTIFKSIRKFITFQLIMNFVACGVSLIGQIIGVDSPITIIQMLWVNIIMDTLGALAFAGEAPIESYMREKPKRRTEPIISRDSLHQILFTGAYTLFLCVAFLRLSFFRNLFRDTESDICFLTAFYALFIFAGIFNCFGARCERLWILSNISKNKPFVFIMIFIAFIQVLMIYYGGSIFRTAPLSVKEFVMVIALSFTVVPFEIIRRVFYKLKRK